MSLIRPPKALRFPQHAVFSHSLHPTTLTRPISRIFNTRHPHSIIVHRLAFSTIPRFYSTQPPPAPPTPPNPTPESPSISVDKHIAPEGSRAAQIWKKVKHEASHYWHGSKLLVSEVRISFRILKQLLRGEALTRREKRQLRRTTTDLLRLIPFSVFVIVPFMELLLPVAIKLFPNMLPSTFEDKFAAEEKQRKLLKVRLEMAKFLQDTLRESGLKANAKILGTDEFKEFFRKVRSTGETPSKEDIVQVAKLFSDDLTLDNLSRPQLASICRYMGINAFGTDNFLKGYIRQRMEHIKRDDTLIDAEGVEELSASELQHACQSRGLRTVGVSPARLREQLSTWIYLHIREGISGVLLILSRAYGWDRTGKAAEGEKVYKSLEAVLSGLPDTLLSEAVLEVDSEKASYKQKLEVLKEQEELIEDEAVQEQKEEEARREKREAEERAKREEEDRTAHSLLPDSELQPEVAEEQDARMTNEQLSELGQALSILGARSSVLKERDELRALMEENLQADEDPATPQSPLALRIRSMLNKIDKQLSAYDAKVGSSLQLISLDPAGRVSVWDLEQALKVIKHAPSPEVVEKVVKKLDADDDGFVLLEHVMDLIGAEGLGVVVDDEANDIIGQGREIIKESRPRKEDIVQE